MTQELNQVQALGHMGGCSAENQSLLRSTAQKEQQKSCPTKPNYYINKVPVQREHTESPLGGQGLRFRSSANSRHHASTRTRWVLIGEDFWKQMPTGMWLGRHREEFSRTQVRVL